MAPFARAIGAALHTCGWTVGLSSATRIVGRVRLRVTSRGDWFAKIRGDLAASGRESDAAFAAMEANEFAWTYRKQNIEQEPTAS